jgi:predicted metal-dependent phosphoesterase TrpH
LNLYTSHAWSQADLHVHTTHSDGGATVPELLEHVARRTSLRVIAVTDHDTIEGALEAERLAPRYGIDVIVGEEVSTTRGHLLALFVNQVVPAGLSPGESIRLIHAQGGLAVAPHPFDASVASLGCQMGADAMRALALDGIEVFNAGVFGPWRASNAVALATAKHMHVAQLGNSDAHALCAVGSGRTWFRGTRAMDVHHAIRQRAVRADGQYLSHQGHARQIFDMLRRMGVRAFTQAIVNGARPASA